MLDPLLCVLAIDVNRLDPLKCFVSDGSASIRETRIVPAKEAVQDANFTSLVRDVHNIVFWNEVCQYSHTTLNFN